MDFEIAERKLKSEQSKLRSKHRAAARRHNNRANATSNSTTNNTTRTARRYAPALSYAAQRQAEEQKKLNEKRLKEAEKKRQVKAGLEQYVKSCERMLGVSSLRSALDAATTTTASVTKAANRKINPNKLFLQGAKYRPTSIYGQGDKITLPPSVLSQLAKEEGFGSSNSNGSPITFRVGILNPRHGGNDNNGDCEFPSSEAMKRKMEELTLKYSSHDDDDKDQQDDSDDDMDDDDDDYNDAEFTKAYREELSHRYISYTHATVVEFTQEDGHIGLPSPIASALLDCNDNRETCLIPTTKTVDPSSCLSTTNTTTTTTTTTPEKEETMDIEEEEEEKTPGHLAWGAFEIPDTEIEILMVKLPKGKRCTLTPTRDAVENGFYGLKDVKLVLEQSLIRTRATLSLNDTVHTWHRGVKFDLKVSSVEPSEFSAVSCINTDIEVDIGVPEYMKEEANKNEETESVATATDQKEKEEKNKKNGFAAAGTGRSLMDPSPSQTQQTQQQSQSTASKQPLSTPLEKDLPPEPPASQTTNICTIQIRNERGQTVGSRRRFDTSQNTMSHLFAYAASALKEKEEEEDASSSFHLVTRFPRIVFSLNDENKDLALGDCGVKEGQMMFFVERG